MSAAENDEIPVLHDVLQYGVKRKADSQNTPTAAPVQADAAADTLADISADMAADAESESNAETARYNASEPARGAAAPGDNPDNSEAKTVALVSLFSRADWEYLECRVRESVLNELQLKIDRPLHQHIENHMIEAIDEALAKLSAELKSSLRENLRDAITQALAEALTQAIPQEIALLQTFPPEETRRS